MIGGDETDRTARGPDSMSAGRNPFRAAYRLTRVALALGGALAVYGLRVRWRKPSPTLSRRAGWMQRHASRILRMLRVEVEVSGSAIEGGGMAVANHQSYLDILAVGSLRPTVFVSKREVRNWPVFGWSARCGGTLFLDRTRRGDVKRLGEEFAPVIEEGLVLALFPEGTSTNGRQVLPFHSSLFEPAIARGWPVTPVGIAYAAVAGTVEEDVCFWRDMMLAPHMVRLASLRVIRVRIEIGAPAVWRLDRKSLAARMREEVDVLRRRAAAGLAAER
ncbi:MAG TPA: lysophospholipid acyltransferase family protein [Candidatus Paceibacterota bacterium]|nr:lysophospholipid acyltransferase family protein [Candidatus Paceibacterota bacterium]